MASRVRITSLIKSLAVFVGCFLAWQAAPQSTAEEDRPETPYERSAELMAAPPDRNEWPVFRGPDTDMTFEREGVYDFGAGRGLRVRWRKVLGSGYSGISVADGRAVTLFTDGTSDLAVALDAHSGEELWRTRIDEAYLGHDGSQDGPKSTPAIADGRVFVLCPHGRLLALDAATGKQLWSTHLAEDHGGIGSLYGFVTSPVVEGETLMVQTGGTPGKSVTALHTATGRVRWTLGSDEVDYQSPGRLVVDGEVLYVFAGRHTLTAVDPATGEIVWTFDHGGDTLDLGGRTASPTDFGRNRLFLRHKAQESMLLEVGSGEDGYTVERLWTAGNLKHTYSLPAYHDGHLYGYNGRFLTCANAENGEIVWRSRQPGDGFLGIAGAHLVVLTKAGSLHVARAAPEGYQELDRIELFESLAWTVPSFAYGRIYVRSLDELAAIEIGGESETSVDATPAAPIESRFARFVARVEASSDKAEMLERFMRRQTSFPILEGEDLVHFVYRGEARDVALIGDPAGHRADRPMKRIEGTDFFYLSERFEPQARLSYGFLKDYEERIPDPLNPHSSPPAQLEPGDLSSLAMPRWSMPVGLDLGTQPRGRLETIAFESRAMGEERRVRVYLPPGYASSQRRHGVLYVHDGEQALAQGAMRRVLDASLASGRASPVILVFLDSAGIEEMVEETEALSEMLVREVVPMIDERYRTLAEPRARLVFGTFDGGFAALYACFRFPGVIANVAVHEPFVDLLQRETLEPLIAAAKQRDLQLYVDWGKYGARGPLEGWDEREIVKRFFRHLEDAGFSAWGGEVLDGFGWGSWRNRTGEILSRFFAPAP